MSTLSERTLLQSVTVDTAGRIEVTRVDQFLRDGEPIHTAPATVQILEPSMDLAQLGLEPLVLVLATAAWTPEQVQAEIQALLAAMKNGHAQVDQLQADRHAAELDAEARHAAALDQARKKNAQDAADVERAQAAIAAAHRELDAEHAALNKRSDEISRWRQELFDAAQDVREKASSGS